MAFSNDKDDNNNVKCTNEAMRPEICNDDRAMEILRMSMTMISCEMIYDVCVNLDTNNYNKLGKVL